MVIGGVFSTLGALCFLPALRRERTLAATAPPAVATPAVAPSDSTPPAVTTL
jgi:hypothetical protein